MSAPVSEYTGQFWRIEYYAKGYNVKRVGFTTDEALAEELKKGDFHGGRERNKVWLCTPEPKERALGLVEEMQKNPVSHYEGDGDLGPVYNEKWEKYGEHYTTTRGKHKTTPNFLTSLANRVLCSMGGISSNQESTVVAVVATVLLFWNTDSTTLFKPPELRSIRVPYLILVHYAFMVFQFIRYRNT
jgi:hypothetical protein